MQYHCQLVDASGRKVRHTESAPTTEALTSALEARGFLVLDIAPTAERSQPAALFGTRPELVELTRALAALLPAGIPLARALATAFTLTSGPVQSATAAVRDRVERGESLASALSAHPAIFPPLYVGLIRAGERSGTLGSAFARLATQLEREAQLRARLLSAMIYPTLLALVGGLAISILLLFVLPRFVEMLADMGEALPRSTALLLSLSAFAREHRLFLLLTPIAFTVILFAYGRTEPGRRAFAELLLALPIIGPMRRHALGARFARLTGILIGGGAPVLVALDDAQTSLGDPIAREETARIRGRVREGAALRAAIAEGTIFPPLLAQLVAVGEESSRLEDFLLKAADLLEERTERAMQRLVTLAEPVMIVLFGGIVGFVALSLMQAMYGFSAGGAFR